MKPLEKFVKSTRNKSGFSSTCLACRRIESEKYRKEYPDQVKAAYHRFREKHPDRILQFGRNDYAKHKKARDAKRKEWRQNHPEKNKEYIARWVSKPNKLDMKRQLSKTWNHTHLESMRIIAKRWRDRHPERKLESNRKRRMLKNNIPGFHTEQEWISLCNRYGNVCLCCKEHKKLTHDHIIPITQKGCTDNIDNIQPLCRACNTKKLNKTIDYRE